MRSLLVLVAPLASAVTLDTPVNVTIGGDIKTNLTADKDSDELYVDQTFKIFNPWITEFSPSYFVSSSNFLLSLLQDSESNLNFPNFVAILGDVGPGDVSLPVPKVALPGYVIHRCYVC